MQTGEATNSDQQQRQPQSPSQVCREWNDFIRKRLWRSPYGLRRLRDRLRGQYFTEQPEETVLQVAAGVGVESQVWTCKADQKILVCGLLNGTANVFNTETKTLLTVLDCQSSGGTMRLCLSSNLIVAASSYGVISIWSRKDYALIFRDHSLHHSEVTGVKMSDSLLITGDSCGIVNCWTVSGTAVGSENFLVDEKRPVTDLDLQQNTILLGSLSSLRVGTLNKEAGCPSLKLIKTDYILECKLAHHLAITCGGKYRKGIQVWDLRSGALLRSLWSDLLFLSLEISNNLLYSVMCSSHLTYPHIYVIDIKSFRHNSENSVQVRGFPCLQSSILKTNICASQTKIFQAGGRELTILEFWYYQVSPWDIHTFLQGIKL